MVVVWNTSAYDQGEFPGCSSAKAFVCNSEVRVSASGPDV